MTVAHLMLTSDVNHTITFLNFKAEATVNSEIHKKYLYMNSPEDTKNLDFQIHELDLTKNLKLHYLVLKFFRLLCKECSRFAV